MNLAGEQSGQGIGPHQLRARVQGNAWMIWTIKSILVMEGLAVVGRQEIEGEDPGQPLFAGEAAEGVVAE